MLRRRSGHERDLRPVLVFALLFSVYLLILGKELVSVDEESVLAMAESMVKHARIDTPQRAFALQIGLPITQETLGQDGRLYSKRGWVWPVIVAPLYGLSLLSRHLGGLHVAHLAGPLVTSLAGSLVYVCGRQLGFAPPVSLLGALGFGLGSISLVYAKFLFSEPWLGLMLMLSISALLSYRRTQSLRMAFLAGVSFALAGATRLPTLALAPVLGLYLLWACWTAKDHTTGRAGWWPLLSAGLAFALGCAIPMALSGIYNWVRFGDLWQSGYMSEAEGFTTPFWVGAYGLLLSPGKGFFWYSPFLLLAIPGCWGMWRRHRAELLMVGALFVLTVLTYSAWYMWWGGTAWGPRFLVPMAGPVALLTLPAIEWAIGPSVGTAARRGRSVALGLVLALSISVQLLGAAVHFVHYAASLSALDPRAEWTFAIYDVRYQPIWGHLRFLQPEHLDLAWLRPTMGRFSIDWWVLGCHLVLVAASLAAYWLAEQCKIAKKMLPTLALLGLGTTLLGQVRLYTTSLVLPEVQPWHELYKHLASLSQPGDVVFVQDGFGNELAYWLDKSRTVRYHWSPRPMPLDRASAGWLQRFVPARLWLVSGAPAAADGARGIERWLVEQGARVTDVELAGGPRLTLWERTPSLPIQDHASLLFGEEVRLLHYAYSRAQVSPGTSLHLVLTWQAERKPSFDYSVFIHLLDANGQLCCQLDGSPVGGFRPMSTWSEGEVVIDRYAIWMPQQCPAGEYHLVVGVYRWDTLVRLSIMDSGRKAMGDTLDLGTIDWGAAH